MTLEGILGIIAGVAAVAVGFIAVLGIVNCFWC